jgi:hypothetical protein
MALVTVTEYTKDKRPDALKEPMCAGLAAQWLVNIATNQTPDVERLTSQAETIKANQTHYRERGLEGKEPWWSNHLPGLEVGSGFSYRHGHVYWWWLIERLKPDQGLVITFVHDGPVGRDEFTPPEAHAMALYNLGNTLYFFNPGNGLYQISTPSRGRSEIAAHMTGIYRGWRRVRALKVQKAGTR